MADHPDARGELNAYTDGEIKDVMIHNAKTFLAFKDGSSSNG
jgi:hypothetical protein